MTPKDCVKMNSSERRQWLIMRGLRNWEEESSQDFLHATEVRWVDLAYEKQEAESPTKTWPEFKTY